MLGADTTNLSNQNIKEVAKQLEDYCKVQSAMKIFSLRRKIYYSTTVSDKTKKDRMHLDRTI